MASLNNLFSYKKVIDVSKLKIDLNQMEQIGKNKYRVLRSLLELFIQHLLAAKLVGPLSLNLSKYKCSITGFSAIQY